MVIYNPPKEGPAVLVYDIETAPMLAYVWRLWDENVGLDQIKQDWHVLSWAAKWLGSPPKETMYLDQRSAKKLEDDKELLEPLWNLLNKADIVITQNGIAFDQKKLNARFAINGLKPPKTVKHVDTLRIAKKYFAFTSNKLEYMTDKLCKKYKKLKHKKFPGFTLWSECLKGNKEAWEEMEKYNKHDVLALEELYTILMPFDNSVNFHHYSEKDEYVCHCGSEEFIRNGRRYMTSGVFQRYACKKCGAEHIETLRGIKKPSAR